MDEGVRNAIHDMTLRARELLTTEARELLEGTYGLDANGALAPADRLPALRTDPEAQEIRRRLEKFLEDGAKAGLKGREAVEKLIKEVAFTHLNRLVAFKMLEARKLTRQILARGAESNAFKFYLVEHPEEEARWKASDVDTAYRRFLLWQCAEMAKEIKVLFDADNLASRLFPRPRVLKELLDMLNAPTLQGAWIEDETIGWVYQDFNEKEKADVFDRLYKKKQKIRREDIPAATQLFTPRWIVSWLVQNTLGRHWLQIHPDSRLAERLNYLAPLGGEIPPLPLKNVCDIEVLDPACGTMHFGLVAFDLLVEMYKEELEKAGSPGWPHAPSVTREEDIPESIIAHNLFGIDIDLRAVQLSALTLYLKAKSVNPSARIQQSNLVCADVLLLDGERLDTFLKAMQFTRPIYERIIRALWVRLKDASHVGSLLRPEEDIRSLIQREREQYRREGEGRLPFPELQQFFEKEAGQEEFWSILEAQIIQAFDEFARQQAQQGADETYFVGEATKGMRLLDLLIRHYDIIITNPPYVFRSNMSDALASFLQSGYPRSKGDLYAAFIERCTELLSKNGRLGMITQQSFMFVSSYEKMRQALLKKHSIETMCHVGPRAFEEISGEKVNTTLFVLRRETNAQRQAHIAGVYFRLIKEPSGEAKRRRFEQALDRLRSGEKDSVVYRYRQADFDAIPGSPWVYWITPGIRQWFTINPNLQGFAKPWVGLQTSDNLRFLRFWWEVGIKYVTRNCANALEVQRSGQRWFPHMKGGKFRRWYGNQEYIVNWGNGAAEMKAFAESLKERVASPPGNGPLRDFPFYFKPGVTWTHTTALGLNARLMPKGFICNVEAMAAYPNSEGSNESSIFLVLALLNSKIANFVVNQLNPTIHYGSREIGTLPLPKTEKVDDQEIYELVSRAIFLAKADSQEDEATYDFIAPHVWVTGLKDVTARAATLAEVGCQLDEKVYGLYGISDEDRAVIEAELAESALVPASEEEDLTDNEDEGEIEPSVSLTREELAHRWISYALGIVVGRFQPGLEGALGCGIVEDESGEKRHLFSPEVEEALNRLADNDGVAVLDPSHEDDLPRKVEQALLLMLGEEQTREVITTIGGDAHSIEASLRLFMERDFFTKVHLKWYQKRSIYWLLQSPRKTYSVYLYHERITQDTLPLIRGSRYLEGKINQTRNRIKEAHEALRTAEGKNKRKLEKELETLQTQLTDLEAFDQALQRVLSAQNERGETVGWAPEIDDGVILNLASLHELLPSWKTEPKKYWEGIEKGDYDWSHTAMRYWPNRVLAKCKQNKSYAIAHERIDVYEGDRR